jgi:hypothetical protein
MFDDSSLKIRLYIWTILLFVLGTTAGYYQFDSLGILLWSLGFAIGLHIFIVSIIRERTSYIDAEANRLKEQRSLYEKVSNMTPEEKYVFGLSYVPPEVMVKVDKTAVVQNELSQTWRKLPIAPYKLKTIAQAMLAGEGFTLAKWVGDKDRPGLLTRSEWDALREAMIDLGMLIPRGDEPRLGADWTSFGEDVMTQVVKDTL